MSWNKASTLAPNRSVKVGSMFAMTADANRKYLQYSIIQHSSANGKRNQYLIIWLLM
jgi:hypothetical protein